MRLLDDQVGVVDFNPYKLVNKNIFRLYYILSAPHFNPYKLVNKNIFRLYYILSAPTSH